MDASAYELDNGDYRVKLALLVELIGNPFEKAIWPCDQISLGEVLNCSATDFKDEPIENRPLADYGKLFFDKNFHIGRIAYLMNNGLNDESDVPIMTFSTEEFNYAPIT